MKHKWTGRAGLVVTVAWGMVALLLGPAVAQEGGSEPPPFEPVPRDEAAVVLPIDDGTYSGSIGLSGAFWMSESGVTMVWSGSAQGPLEFTVADGEMSGIWSMNGSADITGSGLIEASGTNTWTMEGTAYGSMPYYMEGSGRGVTAVTALDMSTEDSYSIPTASSQLQGVMQVCGQVTGNWDQAIDAAFEGGPLQHSIRTYFSVFSTKYVSDFEVRVESLLAQATRAQTFQNIDEVLADLAILIIEAEDLLKLIDEQPEACPADPSFMRIITQVIQDVMHSWLDRWSNEDPDKLQMIALQRLVSIGLRAGAVGAGAADAAVAALLETQAKQVLQAQFDFAVGQDPFVDDHIRTIAVTAVMLGYTFDTGITGEEICMVYEC